MIKYLLLSLFLLMGSAQAQWEHGDRPSEKTIWSIDFINADTGLASASFGTILRTYDGGAHWELRPTPVNWQLYRIVYLNDSVAIAAGEFRIILGTKDGGETWQTKIATNSNWISGMSVFVAGIDGPFQSLGVRSANN